MVDEFELALKQLNTQPKDEFEIALEELSLSGLKPQARGEAEQLNRLREIPEMINRTGGLPIGGEPMVGGPDILAQEQGQTKTFMEDAEGKPVEVRRAQAIDIKGRTIEEPISPDGMSLDFRGNLIKEKTKELQSTSGLPYSEYIQKSNALRSELSKLQKDQQAHEANQLSFLSKLITRKPGVSVELETGLGEERVTGAEGKITSIPIETRASAAIKQIGDQREFIDNIIVNDKFLDYAKTKGIDTPGLISRMAGQYLNVGEAPDRLEELKKNPQIRKLAEEWAMTSPEFMDVATDIFKRAWDGYAGAIGSGTVGPIGLLLKGVGLEETGQSFIDAAEYADQQRQRGQDPRKVGALAQFGRDVSSGLGFTGAAIVTGALGNTARASLGLNSERVINLFQKANTLTFGGLNSAWGGYSEAKSDGATDEQANQAALFSALTQAPLELVSPLQKWISRFDDVQQKSIYKGLNKAAQAVLEGTQEAFFNEMPQEIAGNLVKKFVYDPNQDIFEGVPYAGGVGGASGILTSIFTQMIAGKRAKKQAQQGDQEGSEQTDIESKADEMAASFDTDPAQELAQQMMSVSTDINNLKEDIANDEMGLQAIEKTDPAYQAAELALNEKKANLAALQTQFDKLSAGPAEAPAAAPATPTATKEAVMAKIDELNKEFDALDENDQVGIDRVNEAIAVEQNKLAELTAIEQGVEPQGTTPTREMGLPPSGRRSPFGTFYPDRPVLQAFVKATDKVLGGIKVTSKRAQKLKNAIRTGIAKNAGFLAGTNTEVISSEEYGKLTGGKQVAADTGTYRATFFNGKKYLVVPDVNQLAGISIQGEQRAASRDAALDQESRAAAKKIEEEVIHLSMYQGIQDEYKALKNPKLSEEQYIVKRISDIAKEVKRTNPNALPGVSNAYLNDKTKLLDDMTFSQEFMRMVIQRVRTGQITEDLNAIRKAEQEAFSDQDKGIIIAWKNSILNALQFVRNSIARYLGKGTSTKEVKRMEDAINNILDEYGIVKGEANYEFKDYSAAEPKGELKAAPTEVTPTVKETIEAVHFSRTPMKLEKGIDVSKIKGAYTEESTFGRGFYAAEKADESMWREMDRFKLGDFRNEVKISPQNPLIISPETVKKLGYDSIKDQIDKGNYDAIITRGWSEDTGNKISQRIEQLWTPKFPSGKTSGRFTNVEEFRSANEQAIKEITGLSEYDYTNLDKRGWNQNQIFIPSDIAPDIVSTTPALSETITPAGETSPNTEVESEVVDIDNLADDATYEQIEEAAPSTMVNLKSSIKNVAGSFQQFSKILNDSFKSLVRFAQTIWKKIGKLTIVATGISVITSTPFVIEYQNLQGPKGRADLRPTGLIKNNANLFKPYLKKTTAEKLEKSFETPVETLDLIRNAIDQATPFTGNVDIDFNSIDQFADSINPEEFSSGNTRGSYNYNPLLEISADDIKNAAQSLKVLAKDKEKIESRLRQIIGAMEFFTKRKFKDVKIIIRKTTPFEAATFMALGRAGGIPTSRAQYNPKENTIEIQPQTLISLAEDGIVATSSASNIANELTHNLQYTTNNGQPLGILDIKLSDFDTAATFLWMQMPVYSKNGKLFQTINAESNWADILVSKYFGAKNNIQPKSIESIIAEQPKIQKALQEKETTDFVNSIFDLTGVSSQEIIARAGTSPAIEAKAGVTPIDADPLGNVRDQFGIRASGHINDNTPEERILGESQSLQRGYPEEFATISAKKTILGELSQTATGIKQTLWEHLGDLYHRAGSTTDYGNMVEKVNKFIRWSKNPKEFENQIKSNAIYRATIEKYGDNYTTEEFKEVNQSTEGKKAIEDASRKIRYMDAAFASMYEKLQAFTPLQAMGRNMAIAFGLRRYDVAEQIGKSILSAIESMGDSVVKYGFDYKGVNNLSRSNNQTKQQFDALTKAGELVKNNPLKAIDFFKQVSDRITDQELLAPIAMMEGQSIEARAGVTPEGEPMSKKSQTVMQKITTRMISDLEAQAEMLRPKDNKAYKEYQSRAAQKDKKWNKALISPFSLAANLFTSNSFTAANNALDKIFRNNPDADFFSVAQNLAGMDAATAQRVYDLSGYERVVLMEMMYELSPVYRKEVLDSNMALNARESFALEAINVEAGLARNIALALREGGRIVQAAAALRKLVGAGMAIDTYKRNILASMEKLSFLVGEGQPFNDVANAIRGDRRKSMDAVFNTKSVFSKAVSMLKMAQKNPEKVRQAIREEVSKKQNRSTREILLDFAAGLFDTKEDKYANMVVDQTVQNILSIGMNKKEFTIDNVSKFMYQSFATAAKQMGIQQAGIEKQKKGKRSGKYLEMVKAVIGNDNAYKSFLNDLANRMAEKYQSREAFNADYAELFKALRSNEWADKLRTQAIKDSAEFLNYKFADLFTYLGSQRNVNQEAVKQHIRTELQGTGASNELIEKFIQDTDKYLNEETSRILQDKLGFRIDEKTGKVIPKQLLSQKIQEEAEAQFKAIKNLKDITKLSMTDEGNFKTGLISRIITEVGMDKEQATELADILSKQMTKIILAERSQIVDSAIKKAQEVLLNNKIKPKTNQRTILQKLIEMANMGVLDSEMVYEAFRQTHDFPKNFMPYDAEFTNTLREWGDRISKLPAGVIRSIEEEKMGRALMNKSKFTADDILSSYWYFSLISQASTSAINAMAGANNLIANIAVWSIYNPKSFFPMIRAMYSAVAGKNSAAVNSFLYVMRNGLNPSGMQDEKRAKYPKTNVLEGATPENTPKIVYYLTNFGDGKINFLPDWMNTLLRNVNPRQMMRILKATDMFLREIAYEAKAAQLGATEYSKEGFNIAKRQAELEMASSQAKGKQKDQEILIRANEIYREQRLKDKEKLALAEQDALETVFNQDPVGFFGLLANMANTFLARYKATKFVVPFTNVVANVTNEFINYTPLFSQIRLIGAIKRGVNDPFTTGRTDKQWEMAIKGGIGYIALVIPLIIQALQSGDEEDQAKRPYIQLYSEGPRDPRQKKIWQQRGGQKYSLRVGDTYYSYLATPLVIPLAMAATASEEYQLYKKKGEKLQEKDWGKIAGTVLTAPFSIGFVAVLNQSFLSGVADLLEFKESQNLGEKGTQFFGGIISRMIVPGAFRDINKTYTEERAVGESYLSNFLKEMPGSINFLNKDVGYFGDPVKFPSAVKEEGFGKRLASVFGRIVSTEQLDPAWEIMYRNNLTPPAWDASVSWDNGFRMTKKEELEYIRTAGPRMRDAIIENADDLDSLPLDEAQTLLSNIVAAERRGAKDDLQDSLNIPIDIE